MFFTKQTFEQEARKYWEQLVRGVLVPGERGCAPSEGEVLGMYNDMKTRHPDCKCNILRSGKGKIVQPGDKISGIRIVFSLDAGASVEFVLASSLYYVHFNTDGIAPFSHQVETCDLSQTMKNIEDFVNNFLKFSVSVTLFIQDNKINMSRYSLFRHWNDIFLQMD